MWAWDLVEGKPTCEAPVTPGPQLDLMNIYESKLKSSTDNSIVQIPFKVDAGLWAYIDGVLIRFESVDGGSVTVIDVDDNGTFAALLSPNSLAEFNNLGT